MRITRRLEFDAGHRIPDHQSQCRHLHGHRYAMEITLSGDVIEELDEAAARALKYNLDYKLKLMESALSQSLLDVASYEMLPKVVAPPPSLVSAITADFRSLMSSCKIAIN